MEPARPPIPAARVNHKQPTGRSPGCLNHRTMWGPTLHLLQDLLGASLLAGAAVTIA